MIVADLTRDELARRLRRGEFHLDLSPFVVEIRSTLPSITEAVALMYPQFAVKDAGGFADFHIEMTPGQGLRRWFRRQVNFHFDGMPSLLPLPAGHAYPMFEWGLNWCIAAHCHQFLTIHAAVLERNGKAVIMPAPPGSGKSTLCAGLAQRGWRLLSDELTLVDLASGLVQPMSRPINLKNASIDVIRHFQPDAVMTEPVADTKKGKVALMRPPVESVRRIAEPAQPAWIVFPAWAPGTKAAFVPQGKAQTCLRVARESFNYHIHGRNGFDTVTRLIDACDCYEFAYEYLDDAIDAFAALAAQSS